MSFYAHIKTKPDGSSAPVVEWEPLFTPWHDRLGHSLPSDPSIACSAQNGAPCPHCESLHPRHGHLNKVAHLAATFAAEMFPEGKTRESARQWAYLAGLWHDLGMFSAKFQNYLKSADDIHSGEISEKTDHSTAGAKQAIARNPLGHLIATAIAGHHSGLLDARSHNACLEKRLTNPTEPTPDAPSAVTDQTIPALPDFLKSSDNDFALSLYQRMLFSCLVDADFLATEAFMNPGQAALRPASSEDVFPRALELLLKKIADFGTPKSSGNKARASVLEDCLNSSGKPSGLFTLTVPTGGGKTLSSLAFALKHAIAHRKRSGNRPRPRHRRVPET